MILLLWFINIQIMNLKISNNMFKLWHSELSLMMQFMFLKKKEFC